jgi:hypothetical protein
MKNIIVISLCLLSFLFYSCWHKSTIKTDTLKIQDFPIIPTTNTTLQDPGHYPVFKFADSIYTFKNIIKGTIVHHDYTFRNIGSKDLFIKGTRSSCGCTVAEVSKKVVPPGDSGKITVYINTKENPNYTSGVINITANTYPEKTDIFIRME